MFGSTKVHTLFLVLVFLSAGTIGRASGPIAEPKKALPPGQKTQPAQKNTVSSDRSVPAEPDSGPASKKIKPVVSRPDTATELASDETQVYATKMLNEIIEGIFEGDYNKYARNLSPDMRKFQTREVFLQLQQKLQKNLGKLQTLTYMGFYDQLGKRLALFKARFKKDNNDALITIVLDVKGKKPKASGLWFDAPALEKR